MSRSALWPYLQLMRPANLVTANADILAGFAAAGLPDYGKLVWLLLATTGVYGGGIVFNDVLDARLDAEERPERPIPSGRVSRSLAVLLGTFLFLAGIFAASRVSLASGCIAGLTAACALHYDALGKHHPFLGPLNMGACRGLNLLLGVSAAPAMIGARWFIALIPIAYIAAITAVSAGEVRGGRRSTGLLALVLLGCVLLALPALAFTPQFRLLPLLPFLLVLAGRVLPVFWQAYHAPQPDNLRAAVKAGVLSLIVLDAALAAGYAGLLYGLAVFALTFAAAYLARLFAVT